MHRFLAFLRPLRGRTHHFLFLFLRPLRGRTHHFLFLLEPARGGTHVSIKPYYLSNYNIYYEVDDDEVPSVCAEPRRIWPEYGSEEEGGWLLLEAVGATV